jgi:GH25 family lysozyme M1 (1,4-beta-N-acetylmuramidase)
MLGTPGNEVPDLSDTASLPLPLLRPPSRTLVLVALLSAIFLFGIAAVTTPTPTFAATATTTMAAKCGANLRLKATTNSKTRASIETGAKVTVVRTVTGGTWSTRCAGVKVGSAKWLKISQINGKSVKSLYGVSYLYAAKGLFTAATSTEYASCKVNLRTGAKTSAASKVQVVKGTTVTVVAIVSGGSWATTCAGKAVSGSKWLKISKVNGKSVKSLYGVSYVYAARGLFSTKAPTPTTGGAPTLPDTDTDPGAILEGIDVSHWQGTIDWTKVAAAGKKFAYMKATEHTTFVDNKYALNRAAANAVGIVVGAYHFAQPNVTPGNAAAQADHFINTAQPRPGDLPPVLDLEVRNGLTKTQLQTWTREFLQRVHERTGVRGAIYVSPSFWSTNMGDTTWFAENGYDVLWIAHWTTAEQPTLPANAWGSAGWTFWQYTSSGSVPGISGRVDLNRYNGANLAPILIP